MRRATAASELWAALERAGVDSGQIDLPTIWPAVAEWWRTPVADVAPEDDLRECLLSLAPSAASAGETIFAGSPPALIAGQDLVCLEFGRQFADGGAGLTLRYAADPAWDRLHGSPGWIDMGPSTPSFDASADGRELAQLIPFLEASGIFEVAMVRPPLALVFRRPRWRRSRRHGETFAGLIAPMRRMRSSCAQ